MFTKTTNWRKILQVKSWQQPAQKWYGMVYTTGIVSDDYTRQMAEEEISTGALKDISNYGFEGKVVLEEVMYEGIIQEDKEYAFNIIYSSNAKDTLIAFFQALGDRKEDAERLINASTNYMNKGK